MAYTFTAQELRDAVRNCTERNPELAGRIERAASIIITRDVESAGDGLYKVPSQERPDTTYYVTTGQEPSCQCMDAPRAPQHLCKHVLAACLVKWLTDRRRRQGVAADHHAIARAAAVARGGVLVA